MERLDKILAHTGFGTRKDVKKIIRKGLVSVNGEIIKKDDFKVDEINDEIYIDNMEVNYSKYTYIMLNKPSGYLSATCDEMHATIFELINDPSTGMFPVGRLDIDTVGLLLVTNNGRLAHELLSPKKHVDKKYFVKITNKLSDEHIKLLESGITINDDELCLGAKVEIIDDNSLYLTIREGKFHQVKKMMFACESEVTFLQRVEMGPLVLDESLQLGEYRYLTEDEVSALLKVKPQ